MTLQNKQCQAFLAVLQYGSFEVAAQKLCISASAVSLRVQSLEKSLAQILILRERPCRATAIGLELAQHLQQMQRIEESFLYQLAAKQQQQNFYSVRIASHADSLATWLLPALSPILTAQKLLLDIQIKDQTQTHQLLESGQVNACISTETQAMQGCVAVKLGILRYRLVASPAFAQKWFAHGVKRQSLQSAPAIIFDRHDQMHRELLQQQFGLFANSYPYHHIPSAHEFLNSIVYGFGYGLVPELQMQDYIQRGELIYLAEDSIQPIDLVLYWHHWKQQAPILQTLSQALQQQAQAYLRPIKQK
ncbi:LysR family transcriptional regulator ArgP [Acinetobacter larvae]|uniref:Transcriptional regulator ArgP n=1 Tax=Acinetobacter larvae TaxID=1789224 RepID=A0A1B2LXJ8_9GAMM|nr:LysR family transcriptional regulator ArgP [Acinetobacter larvae]AOA57674.1 transcriptional regulator ArgP [Acinetobacter larvae]